MSRDSELFLHDIFKSSEYILEFVKGLDYETFVNDEKTLSAVIRKLVVIGEAVKNLPDSIKHKYSSIPWRDISGTRDHLIHGYFGLDFEIVWNTIQSDIPKLILSISDILNELDPE